jgi:hypothetical protein
VQGNILAQFHETLSFMRSAGFRFSLLAASLSQGSSISFFMGANLGSRLGDQITVNGVNLRC